MPSLQPVDRRMFLGASAALASQAATLCVRSSSTLASPPSAPRPAQIAITLDLEMSAQYPRREMTEWNYEKGNLDEDTKRYALEAARRVARRGGVIHFFCVGRVLEQPNIDWLLEIAQLGHPIGNHTYDHINVTAQSASDLQFRFQRAPWLLGGQAIPDAIRENIRLASTALASRGKINVNGFRTPGGFHRGLVDRPDLQAMLLDLGYSWISSKYPAHPAGTPKQPPSDEVYAAIVSAQQEAQPFVYPSGLVEIPMSPISDVTAFRTHYWKREYFLRAIGASVDWAIETGGAFNFLAHPSCLVVEDPGFETIDLICDRVAQAGTRAQLVGLDKIAARMTADKPSREAKSAAPR
ncbi:MAG: polysaccharide deacetylase family protein [Pirellulales bacterium]